MLLSTTLYLQIFLWLSSNFCRLSVIRYKNTSVIHRQYRQYRQFDHISLGYATIIEITIVSGSSVYRLPGKAPLVAMETWQGLRRFDDGGERARVVSQIAGVTAAKTHSTTGTTTASSPH